VFLEEFQGRPFLQKGPPLTPPQKLSSFCTIVAVGDNGVVCETPMSPPHTVVLKPFVASSNPVPLRLFNPEEAAGIDRILGEICAGGIASAIYPIAPLIATNNASLSIGFSKTAMGFDTARWRPGIPLITMTGTFLKSFALVMFL